MTEYNLTGEKANRFGRAILDRGTYAFEGGEQIGHELIMKYNIAGEVTVTWSKSKGITLININRIKEFNYKKNFRGNDRG